MNCKPGDLAVVVYHPSLDKYDAQLFGSIRRVVSIKESNDYGQPCWAYEGEPLFIDYPAPRGKSEFQAFQIFYCSLSAALARQWQPRKPKGCRREHD